MNDEMKKVYWGAGLVLLVSLGAWRWLSSLSTRSEGIGEPGATNNPGWHLSPQDRARYFADNSTAYLSPEDKARYFADSNPKLLFSPDNEARERYFTELAERRYTADQKIQQKQILEKLPKISQGSARLVSRWEGGQTITDLQFSPDGSFLAVASYNSSGGYPQIDVRRTNDWKTQKVVSGLSTGISGMVWSPNSRFLAVPNQGVDLWDIKQNRLLTNLYDGSGFGRDRTGVWGPLLFSADSSKLATFGEDPESSWQPDGESHSEAYYIHMIALKVWDTSTGKCLLVQPGPRSNEQYMLVRNTNDPTQIDFAQRLYADKPIVRSSPNTTSDSNPTLYVFNGTDIFDLQNHPDQPFATIKVPTGNREVAIAGNAWIYATLTRRGLQLFCSRDQKPFLRLLHLNRVSCVALSSDAHTLAVAASRQERHSLIDGTTLDSTYSWLTIYHLSFRRT
ncbi:hypothetical protein IAD21_03405 [Abditibacteriota bacterium]|nr:hypothetical protein IAD21_03405 [Abditibacteriota bacterium]